MAFPRFLASLGALALVACGSPTIPTAADMERYYHEAEKIAQRDIDRLAARRDRGEITSAEFERREAAIRDGIPRRASEIAWTRHDLAESERRSMGIPTPGAPMAVQAPGRGGMAGSLYHAAGDIGSTYQGAMAPSTTRSLQPGTASNTLGTTSP